jgi:serine/threonine protein kinase
MIPRPRGAPPAPPAPPSGLREGAVVAEKFRLTRLLRRGGMGSVWEAMHLGLQSLVVIKFVRFDRSKDHFAADDVLQEQQLRTRFEREARTAAQIRSANVVQILDYGVDNGTPYLVMEKLEGEDLAARLKRAGRLSLAETAKIVGQIARALERAHAAGLVHRDLKPENVFLATDGDETVVKVLDFGVAKELRGEKPAEDSTIDGVVIGTPSYMSPEQAVGRTDIDQRSDLWSLGVIAFRALTGVKPFEASMVLEAVLKICSGPIPIPSQVAPDLGPAVDAFFARALARPVDERFQSAREMARALEQVAGVAQAPLAGPAPLGPVLVGMATPMESAFTPSGGSRLPSAGTLDALAAEAPVSSRRSPMPFVIGAVVLGVGLGAAMFALRPASPTHQREVAAAASAAPSPALETPPPSQPAPSAATPPSVAPSTSASAPAPAVSSAVAPSAPSPRAPVAAPRRPAGKKPRMDVGY